MRRIFTNGSSVIGNCDFSKDIIITGYDCIGGFERVHMGNRQVVYAWVGSHFGLNFVAVVGGSSDTASHIVKDFSLKKYIN